MRSDSVNGIAACIVQRGAYSALDLNDGQDTLAAHVGNAYEVWYSDWMRAPGAQSMARDEVAYSVRQRLILLGLMPAELPAPSIAGWTSIDTSNGEN